MPANNSGARLNSNTKAVLQVIKNYYDNKLKRKVSIDEIIQIALTSPYTISTIMRDLKLVDAKGNLVKLV